MGNNTKNNYISTRYQVRIIELADGSSALTFEGNTLLIVKIRTSVDKQ